MKLLSMKQRMLQMMPPNKHQLLKLKPLPLQMLRLLQKNLQDLPSRLETMPKMLMIFKPLLNSPIMLMLLEKIPPYRLE